jgi:cell division transport system permease protein
MSEFRLAFKLGLGTLRSRPTLTFLAIVLLAMGSSLMGGLTGTVYLLRGLQAEFLSALTIEVELAGDADSLRTAISERIEEWPGAEFVQYVSPTATMREVERELGEDLDELFGGNPFPPLLRVRFGQTDLATLDSLTKAASAWPGVVNVVYPRQLWNRLNELLRNFSGSSAWLAGLLTILAIFLVGLCLRAQVRYRAPTWELVGLFGMSERTLGLTLLVQETLVGFIGGLLACGALWLLTVVLSWLLFYEVAFPGWFYFLVWLSSIALAILAGILSPRRLET